jgi:UDP-glucose 4-epimerase
VHVLLTGAAGNLGSETLPYLLSAGHRVRTFELDTPSTRKVLTPFADKVELVWGDITDTQGVMRALAGNDAVIHDAAITPPRSEFEPELALRVNALGMQNLLLAAKQQARAPLIVFASSMAVFGITQPELPPPRRASDAIVGTDHYSKHKVACEELLVRSGLPHSILRIGVSPPRHPQQGDPRFLRLLFAHSLDSRLEFVHPADVGLAQSNVLTCPAAHGRVLLIGGGARCQITNRTLVNGLFERVGVGALPDEAFADTPLYGDWLDTQESQHLLAYQRHDHQDFLAEIGRNFGLKKWGISLARPLVRRLLLRYSEPYARRAT